jgi:GSH-dependent disulfide-bond oxidoreductase
MCGAGRGSFQPCLAMVLWEKLPNLKRLVDEISARPAAQKAVALKDRHKFKTEMDAEAMRAMFPHLNVKVA